MQPAAKHMQCTSKLPDMLQAEADFSSLAERLRDGESQRADRDRLARDALARSAHTEAQLRTTEVCSAVHQPSSLHVHV